MKKYIGPLTSFLFSRNLNRIEVFVLAVFLLSIYSTNLLAVEFQPDETFWIVSSTRLDKFLAGEFDDQIWIDEPLISFEVRPVPSYIVAIGQRIGGVKANSLPVYWDWSLPRDENIGRGAMPSAQVLWLSRLPMALISVFSLLGMILLIAKAHSRIAAYLFALMSINEYFLLHLRRAMSEAPLLFFTVLVLYACYKLLIAVQEKSLKKIILWAVLAGVLSGVAGQSKLTGLACTGIAILGIWILLSRSADFSMQLKRGTFLIVTFLVVCTSILVFYITYPFFYENTIHRVLATFYIRGQVVQSQINTYTEQTIQPNERPAILFQRVFDYPLGFRTNGVVDAVLHWVNFIVAGFGVFYSVKQIGMKQENQIILIVLVLGALICATPMLFVPLHWDRYYLYLIFFNCVFFAIGMGQLLFLWLYALKDSWIRS